MAINLVSKEDKNLKKIAKVASLSKLLATVVLFGYLAGVGVVYWWWFTLTLQERVQSDEEKQLLAGLEQMVGTEVLARQLDLRVKTVDSQIKSRIQIAPKLSKVLVTVSSGGEVLDWAYGVEGTQTLTVQTTSALEVETMVERFKAGYKTVKLVKMTRRNDAKWEAKLAVSDGT